MYCLSPFSLSREEKHAAIRDAIRQERALRSEGRLEDMAKLLGPKAHADVGEGGRLSIASLLAVFVRIPEQYIKHSSVKGGLLIMLIFV